MAGLKGLGRESAEERKALVKDTQNDDAAAAFINRAPVKAAPEKTVPKKQTGPKYIRTNFSLDAKSIKQIDKLELYPRTFKVTRSDVVRAGLLALEAMEKKEAIALLAKVAGADPSEQEQQGE